METIRADLTAAMRAKDALKLRTLRAVLAAVQEAEVAGKEAKTLSDAEVEAVIAAQVKRRVEAAEAFTSADRPEKAEAEMAEKAILELYLPEALSDDDLVALVDACLAEGGWLTKADMGQAMKAVNGKVAGRANGKTVADLVKARLSQ